MEDLSSGRSGDTTHNKHRPFVYWVSRSHGVRFLPWGYERFGPVLTSPNPQAVRAREFIQQWNREKKAESIVWSADEISQLVLVAQGKMDVSQCRFTGYEFSGNDAVEAGRS